jgi:hypothetical protein
MIQQGEYMLKYRVIVHANLDQLLDEIRNRMDPEYRKWTSRDFVCKASAERYAFLAGVASGRKCSVSEICDDQRNRLLTRLDRIFVGK